MHHDLHDFTIQNDDLRTALEKNELCLAERSCFIPFAYGDKKLGGRLIEAENTLKDVLD